MKVLGLLITVLLISIILFFTIAPFYNLPCQIEEKSNGYIVTNYDCFLDINLMTVATKDNTKVIYRTYVVSDLIIYTWSIGDTIK